MFVSCTTVSSKRVRGVNHVRSVGRQQEDFFNSIASKDTNLAILVTLDLSTKPTRKRQRGAPEYP
eukprot:55265-Prorocentrum_minimum.AAC.6